MKFYILVGKLQNVSKTEESACPKNFNCVTFSKCPNIDTKSVVYPCIIDDVTMVCCPKKDKPEPELVSRTSAFPEKCGEYILEDRIVNGKLASIGQYPFMALMGYTRMFFLLLYFIYSTSTFFIEKTVPFPQFLCGGSIITSKYILTAGHCINMDRSLIL